MQYLADVASDIIAQFPFHDVQAVDTIDGEVVRFVSDVVTVYLRNGQPSSEIVDIINFFTRLVYNELRRENRNHAYLESLLNVIVLCFLWTHKFRHLFNADHLIDVLHTIIHLPNIALNCVIACELAFIELISCTKGRKFDFDFCVRVQDFYTLAPTISLKLKLSHEILFYVLPKTYPEMHIVYKFVIDTADNFQRIEIEHDVINLLKCVRLMYCTCFEPNLLCDLSINLAHNNFPDCITNHTILHDFDKELKEVFRYEIEYLFTTSSFYIEQLSDDDMKIVKYYIQYIYMKVSHIDRIQIVDNIKIRFEENGVPRQNIILMRSIYLLLSAYRVEGLEDLPNLKEAFTDENTIELYLTCHPPQLVWMLLYGNRAGKATVTSCFLQSYSDATNLYPLFRKYREFIPLFDVACYNTDPAVQRIAMEALSDVTGGHIVNRDYCQRVTLLLKELLRAICNIEFTLDNELLSMMINLVTQLVSYSNARQLINVNVRRRLFQLIERGVDVLTASAEDLLSVRVL